MLGDGIRSAPPRALFERMKAAADEGENYKALYLARVLTDVAPELAGAWSNRATLAGSLGLTGEQAAAQQHADQPSAKVVVPAEFLPGRTLPARPVSLPDLAGAMTLLADDMRAREGIGVVAAVKDDVSGAYVRTIHYDAWDDESLGHRDAHDESFAAAMPPRLIDILPNAFVLHDVHAMAEHDRNGGAFAGALLLGALAGASAGMGDSSSSSSASAASDALMRESGKVVSRLKGGSFSARTFPGGTAKDAVEIPSPAGEREAIDLPAPVLWLSGGSQRPTVTMRLVNAGGGPAKAYLRRFGGSAPTKQEVMRSPDLKFPRVAKLCDTRFVSGFWTTTNCSEPLSLMELMLRGDDIMELAKGDAGIRPPSLGGWDYLYQSAASRLVISAEDSYWSDSREYVGFDTAGNCYAFNPAPEELLAPAPTTAAASRRAAR